MLHEKFESFAEFCQACKANATDKDAVADADFKAWGTKFCRGFACIDKHDWASLVASARNPGKVEGFVASVAAALPEDFAPYRSQETNLQNWLAYRICNDIVEKLGVPGARGYDDGFDADVCMKHPLVAQSLGWDKPDFASTFIDCTFSVQTSFGRFMRLAERGARPSLMEMLSHTAENEDRQRARNNLPSPLDRDIRWLDQAKLLSSAEGILKTARGLSRLSPADEKPSPDEAAELLKRCWTAFDELALRTHTPGNYMPCPDNAYNADKGSWGGRYNDRIDLVVHDALTDAGLSEKRRTWFKRHWNELMLDDLLDDDGHVRRAFLALPYKTTRETAFTVSDLAALADYLEAANALIADRSRRMAELLPA